MKKITPPGAGKTEEAPTRRGMTRQKTVRESIQQKLESEGRSAESVGAALADSPELARIMEAAAKMGTPGTPMGWSDDDPWDVAHDFAAWRLGEAWARRKAAKRRVST